MNTNKRCNHRGKEAQRRVYIPGPHGATAHFFSLYKFLLISICRNYLRAPIALLCLCASVVAFCIFSPGVIAADLSGVLGTTHVDGKYYLTNQDYLDEGADQVLATGTTTIKLYLNPGSLFRYPWNSHWPENIHSLVELARTPYFKSVFAKPFKTYILTTYSFGADDQYWVESFTPADAARETQQFYDLTRYLLTTYNGTGKTFVLQNWEGDWSLRADHQNHIYDAKFTPTPTAINNMIHWFNARQTGIVKARTEVKNTDVHVYQAAESNRVVDSENGRPGVANSVLPHTTVDLASYSSWDSQNTEAGLAKAIDFLAANLPPTAAFGHDTRSVYIGEYGAPENQHPERVNLDINNTIAVAKAKHLPWAIYWEVYCNEIKPGFTAPANNNDQAMRGFWLIKPDGTPALAWQRLRQAITTFSSDMATTKAIKSHLHLSFTEKFDRPDSSDLGSAWSTTSHYGTVVDRIAGHHLQMTIPSGKDIPWGSATLDLTNSAILGRALQPGDYFEFTLQRVSTAGMLGVEIFNSDQFRQGSGKLPGASPMQAWNHITWVPISFDSTGKPKTFDWNKPHTIGVHFTSADGHFATFAYYIDGEYAASWMFRVGNRELKTITVYTQSDQDNSRAEFSDLRIFTH